MIPFTPTAAEQAIIDAGTGGCEPDRIDERGILRLRVQREPDAATTRTVLGVARRVPSTTGVVFAVLRWKGGTKPEPRGEPMRDSAADGAAVIANVPRRGEPRWCDMRHAGRGDCCGRVVDWVGEFRDEYGEPQNYAHHSWSTEGAGMGSSCEAHLAEASAPIQYGEPDLPGDAPALTLIVREEPAGCECCSGYDVAVLVCPVTGNEVARIEDDVPEPRHDAGRWARAAKRTWVWADKRLDLRRVRIVDGR